MLLEFLKAQIFHSNQIIENRRLMNLEAHVAFMDYEKAFDMLCKKWSVGYFNV